MINIEKKVAVTGASGSLAADIIPAISESGWEVIGIDIAKPSDSLVQRCVRDFHVIDMHDNKLLRDALKGCSAIIHLAGIPLEDDWNRLVEANVLGTQSVLAAAVSERVRRVVLASSIHVAGGHAIPVDPRKLKQGTDATTFEFVSADIETYPTTFYGVTKVTLEALGQMYSFRYGLEVVCVRIASRFAKPQDERMLSTWLSPRDAANLMIAATSADANQPFSRVWGVSNNTRNYLSLDNGKALGFSPLDDAEQVSPEELRTKKNDDRDSWDFLLGGIFSSPQPPRMPGLKKGLS